MDFGFCPLFLGKVRARHGFVGFRRRQAFQILPAALAEPSAAAHQLKLNVTFPTPAPLIHDHSHSHRWSGDVDGASRRIRMNPAAAACANSPDPEDGRRGKIEPRLRHVDSRGRRAQTLRLLSQPRYCRVSRDTPRRVTRHVRGTGRGRGRGRRRGGRELDAGGDEADIAAAPHGGGSGGSD